MHITVLFFNSFVTVHVPTILLCEQGSSSRLIHILDQAGLIMYAVACYTYRLMHAIVHDILVYRSHYKLYKLIIS